MSEAPGQHRRTPVAIVGDKVALSPLRHVLLPTYHRWFNEFGTLRTLGDPPGPLTMEEQAARYDSVVASGPSNAPFTIYERAHWRPIGTCSLIDIDERRRTAEVVIIIGESESRWKGYGTEVMRLLLDYAFTTLGLHNVMLKVYEFNLAGRRAYDKAGFREFGRRRQAQWMGGRLWDIIYMECLSTEFERPVLPRISTAGEPRT